MSADFFPPTMPEGRTPVYFFSRNYFPTRTGATERFRRYLPGLADRGVDFFIVTSWTDRSLPQIEHLGHERVRRLPVESDHLLNTERLLLPAVPELLRAAPGTVQVGEITPGMRPHLADLRRAGHRVVLIRTIMPTFSYPLASLRGLKSRLGARLEARALDRIVAGSTVMRDGFSFGSPRLNQKYAIIPHGINLDRFRPVAGAQGKAALRRALGLREDAPVLLTVGSVMERKRTHLIVEAFGKINAANPDAQLVIVGENATRVTLATQSLQDSFHRYNERVAKIADSCSPGSVIFTGEIENVEDYYRAANVFAFASAIEGMPNAVIEAMASGLPCVVTPFKGLPETEFGTPGQEFVLSDTGASAIADDLFKLTSDRDAAKMIGAAARRFAEKNLNAEDAIDAYAKVYHNR